MTRPETLNIGLTTWRWVRASPYPQPNLSLQLRALYAWRAWWFDRLLVLQNKLALDSSFEDPVFVLGFWRSGTTFLHELLSLNPALLAPSTWQCMNPAGFVFHPAPPDAITILRPMDGMPVSPDSPQEDEFALLAFGAPSIYRAFIDPARIGELICLTDPDYWNAPGAGDWLGSFRAFLSRVCAQRPGIPLLKSPGHCFRIRALVDAFPRSRFVWLVRDPGDTYQSNLKMWLAMFARYGLSEPRPSGLEDFLAEAIRNLAKSLGIATSLLDRTKLVVVDYSHFVSEPAKTVEQIHSALGLPFDVVVKNTLTRNLASKSIHRVDQYPPPIATTLPALEELTRAYEQAVKSHGVG